jgi:hypothetical protein
MIQREVYGKELGSHNSQITQLVRSIAKILFFQFYIYECSMQLLCLELEIFLYLLIGLVMYTLRQSAWYLDPF